MIDDLMIYYYLIILPIWLTFRLIYLRRTKKKKDLNRELIFHVFVIYLFGVIYLTLEPFAFRWPDFEVRPFYFDTALFYQLTHMATGYLHLQLLYSVGNIMLFFPFGFLAPVVFRRLNHPILIVLLGFIVSLTIELTQALFTLTRSGTVDDLFFNTLGTLLGYLFYRFIKRFVKN